MPERSSTFESEKINSLKQVITESLRVQLGGADLVEYIDVANKLTEVTSRNNHVVFGRRGTGKTLMLHSIEKNVASTIKVIYINCEDYKNHSFPNVLIELLDATFSQMERELTNWFGRQKQLKRLVGEVRAELKQYKENPDSLTQNVKHTSDSSIKADAHAGQPGVIKASASASERTRVEREYQTNEEKIVKLNLLLPKIKAHVREVFEATNKVSAIFIELDDFYHLKRSDQPFIIDFVHRLCKDVPLFFKVGTLRHVSALYVSKRGQPFGAQERHDFQPVNIDFTLTQLDKTTSLLKSIIEEMGRQVGWTTDDLPLRLSP